MESASDIEATAIKREFLSELNRYPFSEPWWLRGAHPQTIWSAFFRALPSVQSIKEQWPTPDADLLNVHLVNGSPERPVVVLLHGLEGSVRSNYIVGLMHAFAEREWNVAAMEHRSCGGDMNRAKRLYHSGETSDLEFVVDELHRRHPNRRIYIAGFSLGGNVTAKWLGQMGDRVPPNVAAAAVVCPPFDLTRSGPHIDRALFGLYVRRFLKSLVPKAIEKERQYPGSLDLEKIRACRTFAEFDTYATAALHGFRDAEDYWASVGCGQFLHGIRRPTLLIASADDPFNPGETLPHELAEKSPYLLPRFTDRGGHVGFVYGKAPRQSRHWAEAQIVRFFELCESR